MPSLWSESWSGWARRVPGRDAGLSRPEEARPDPAAERLVAHPLDRPDGGRRTGQFLQAVGLDEWSPLRHGLHLGNDPPLLSFGRAQLPIPGLPGGAKPK